MRIDADCAENALRRLAQIFDHQDLFEGPVIGENVKDKDFAARVVGFFSNRSWIQVDRSALLAEFDREATMAFYCMSIEAKCYFFPAMIKIVLEEICDLNVFAYLLPSILSGVESQPFRKRLFERMSDEQKRFSLFATSMIYYAIDEPLDHREIAALADAYATRNQD